MEINGVANTRKTVIGGITLTKKRIRLYGVSFDSTDTVRYLDILRNNQTAKKKQKIQKKTTGTNAKGFPKKSGKPLYLSEQNNRSFNRKVKDLISYFIQLLY